MTPYINEILAEINANPALLSAKYGDNAAVRTLLEYAFDASKKFILPEGDPPFTPDAAPIGMSPSNFYQQIRKLYIFTRADLSANRREQLFIQMLESLHPTEAKVCLLVKDQTLTSAYPNITASLVASAGIVAGIGANTVAPVEVTATEEVAKPAGKGKNLVVSLQDAVVSSESFGSAPAKKPATKKPTAKKNTSKK